MSARSIPKARLDSEAPLRRAGAVDNAGRHAGVIMGGDLPERLGQLGSPTAKTIVIREGKTVTSDTLAEGALDFVNYKPLTCAVVMKRTAPMNTNVPIGIEHVHHFLSVSLA